MVVVERGVGALGIAHHEIISRIRVCVCGGGTAGQGRAEGTGGHSAATPLSCFCLWYFRPSRRRETRGGGRAAQGNGKGKRLGGEGR